MALQFTPAVQRALEAASHWTSCDNPNGLTPPELLMGLLAETECRAAAMLADRGIDAPLVRQRWPELTFSEQVAGQRSDEFSAAVQAAFEAAAARLIDYPQPLVLATEHLLLGLIASQHELAAWLAQRGFDLDTLEAEIHRLAGHQPGPLAVETLDLSVNHHTAEPQALPLPMGEDRGEGTTLPLPVGERRGERESFPRPWGEETALLRIIDAAANRAREGLRVLEDFARFALDDRRLTEQFKQLRHALAAELTRLDSSALLAARNTPGDVGTQLTAEAERRRPDLQSVLAANFKRVQESLRSLEEFGKTLDAELGAAMKQLRYRVYALECAAAAATPSRTRRIEQARLYVLVDGRKTIDEFDSLIRSLVAAGVDVIQLRDKRLDDRELLERARRLREITRATDTLFIMNDRADLAALAAADGVHVGQEELSARGARAIVGPHALVGVSTHSLAQARQAVLDGADYIGVGPTFASATKHFDSSQLTGLDLLRAVAAAIQLPAFAIGGIDADNLPDVLAAGISRVAVSSAIVAAPDPCRAAKRLRETLGR